MKNYYKILGLDSKSSECDINHADWKLSLKFHPDKGALNFQIRPHLNL